MKRWVWQGVVEPKRVYRMGHSWMLFSEEMVGALIKHRDKLKKKRNRKFWKNV